MLTLYTIANKKVITPRDKFQISKSKKFLALVSEPGHGGALD